MSNNKDNPSGESESMKAKEIKNNYQGDPPDEIDFTRSMKSDLTLVSKTDSVVEVNELDHRIIFPDQLERVKENYLRETSTQLKPSDIK